MAEASARRVRRFLRWMKENGIVYSDALGFSFGNDQVVAGAGVKALRDLQQGELIATIPKKACLTVITTGASEALENAQLAGGLGLAVAIMYERSKGKKSPWFQYLELLPQQEMVPFVWSEEEIDSLLIGTELHEVIKQDRQLMKEDWEENIAPLTEDDPSEFPAKYFTFDCYLAAKSLVTSRSFEVDHYHGHGMVALADLFNHKTAAEDVHFMNNSSDLEEDQDSTDQELENELDTHSHRADDDLEGNETGSVDDSQMLEMILVKDVAKGSEIFNTYGQLSNAALLHRYGFTELNNPFDIVNIDMECMIQVLSSHLTKRHIRKRGALWRKAGFMGCESQGCEYFEIPQNGKPQIELLLLLFVMHASSKACRRLEILADKVDGKAKKAAKALGWHKLQPSQPTKKQRRSIRQQEDGFTDLERWLLTSTVIEILVLMLDKRDEQYGNPSGDDQKRLNALNSRDNSKAFHAISLRVAERRILQKCKHAMKQLQRS